MLLYDRDLWVVTSQMPRVLTAFRHQAAQRITGMTAKCGAGGEWEYPAVEEEMDAVGLDPIRLYIKRRNTTIA